MLLLHLDQRDRTILESALADRQDTEVRENGFHAESAKRCRHLPATFNYTAPVALSISDGIFLLDTLAAAAEDALPRGKDARRTRPEDASDLHERLSAALNLPAHIEFHSAPPAA